MRKKNGGEEKKKKKKVCGRDGWKKNDKESDVWLRGK